jgi:hypothetical protein
MSQNERWLSFHDPRLPLSLIYPELTPHGRPVTTRLSERDGVVRAHLLTVDSDEVYVEVTRYPGTAPEQCCEQLLADIRSRFEGLTVHPLQERAFVDRRALALSFAWDAGERMALFIPCDQDTCRVIYDPRGALNSQILTTINLGNAAAGDA